MCGEFGAMALSVDARGIADISAQMNLGKSFFTVLAFLSSLGAFAAPVPVNAKRSWFIISLGILPAHLAPNGAGIGR